MRTQRAEDKVLELRDKRFIVIRRANRQNDLARDRQQFTELTFHRIYK